MRNVPLCSYFSKLPPAIRARCSIIICFCLRLIWLPTFSSSAASSIGTTSCTHSLSKHLWLIFPLRACTLAIYWYILAILGLLASWGFRGWLCSLSLHQYLLMFIGNNSMSLTVKGLSFLHENLLAYLAMLSISLRIKGSSTARAFCKIHIRIRLECIRP